MKQSYKSIPESYKALSSGKYDKVISDLESILLDISADGDRLNSPDGRISEFTLRRWAECLRDALEMLSKAQ